MGCKGIVYAIKQIGPNLACAIYQDKNVVRSVRYFLIGRRVYCVPFVDLDYEVVQERAKTNLRTLEQKKRCSGYDNNYN